MGPTFQALLARSFPTAIEVLSSLYLRDQVSLTRGMLLRFFSNLTSNTSKYIVIIVLWFVSLLYSLRVEF
jgi:hypothetical protein